MLSTFKLLSRLPKLQVKVTMRSRIKEHRRQQVIKSKLGDKYKPHSPRVTIKQDALKLNPYLASADSIPLDLPDIDLNSASSTQHKTTLGIKLTALLNNLQLTSSNESISQTSSKSIKKSTSNYQPNEAIEIRKDVELDVSQYNIETHSNSIPLSTHQKGPYFAYNIIPDDSNFIFFKTPKLLEKKDVNLQAELTNRIVSLKNSNAKERLNFNKQRILVFLGKMLEIAEIAVYK